MRVNPLWLERGSLAGGGHVITEQRYPWNHVCRHRADPAVDPIRRGGSDAEGHPKQDS